MFLSNVIDVFYLYKFCIGLQRRCPFDGYFRCKRSGQCFSPYYVCDGYDNCPDGTDEENCGKLLWFAYNSQYENFSIAIVGI